MFRDVDFMIAGEWSATRTLRKFDCRWGGPSGDSESADSFAKFVWITFAPECPRHCGDPSHDGPRQEKAQEVNQDEVFAFSFVGDEPRNDGYQSEQNQKSCFHWRIAAIEAR